MSTSTSIRSTTHVLDVWTTLTSATALGMAAAGGAFVVYSSFTGTALARLPGETGVVTMQELNRTAVASPVFMALMFVPVLAGVVLAVRALVQQPPGTVWLVSGVAVYVVGVVGMTMAFHVPRNEALMGWDPVARAADWGGWISTWIAGNHVRSVAGLAAAVLLAVSARRQVTGN